MTRHEDDVERDRAIRHAVACKIAAAHHATDDKDVAEVITRVSRLALRSGPTWPFYSALADVVEQIAKLEGVSAEWSDVVFTMRRAGDVTLTPARGFSKHTTIS